MLCAACGMLGGGARGRTVASITGRNELRDSQVGPRAVLGVVDALLVVVRVARVLLEVGLEVVELVRGRMRDLLGQRDEVRQRVRRV